MKMQESICVQLQNMKKDHYDIVIVGGGVSGTALLYTLARYSNAARIALIEKYSGFGRVNSAAHNNSQTLHIGDIETNYSVDKARQVKSASLMIARYAEKLPEEIRGEILFPTPKMILAVGVDEVSVLAKRFESVRSCYPHLHRLDREGIAAVEPMVVAGRDPRETILALYSTDGYAVDYERLARSFVHEAHAHAHDPSRRIQTLTDTCVTSIERMDELYVVRSKDGKEISARVVVMSADAYSLLFAKRLGYGKEFSLIPVAGTFYFSKQILNGKVYTMQNPRLPFAAVHGDRDVRVGGVTRWGPTARFFPVLEARNLKTTMDYFRVSGLHRWQTWVSFFIIVLEPVRFFYLLKNLLYEMPLIGTLLFARQVCKIVPSIRTRDISRAKGFGGMRLQRVDTNTHEMLLGEGKIIGDNIIFNMTPSPGASVCLYNAMRDAETIEKFFPAREYRFDKEAMIRDLCGETPTTIEDTSLRDTYAS